MLCRRNVLISLVWVAVAATLLARPAAATPEGARAFVTSLGDRAVATFADPSLSEEARLAKLRRIFVKGFDVRTISLFVLGRYRRTASKAQIEEYRWLFRDFIVTTYASRFGDYAGESLAVKGTRTTGDGDVIVASQILRPGRDTIRVDWRVRETTNSYKIVDVVVEGVSMVITQRDEFASVIRSSGGRFEGLLAALRKKAGAR